MSKKKKNIKYPVTYTYNGQTTEYVDKLTSELRPEYNRVKTAILQGLRILGFIRRHKHPGITSARFNLMNSGIGDPDQMEDAFIAQELGRLSFLMQDSVNQLNVLSGSRMLYLEQARFELTFGQVPKKRELHGPSKSGKELYEEIDSGDSGNDNSGEW